VVQSLIIPTLKPQLSSVSESCLHDLSGQRPLPIFAPYLNLHSLSLFPPILAYSFLHFLQLLVSKIITFVAFLVVANVPAKDRFTTVMAFVKAIVTPSFTLLGLFSDEEN
jgi:hypothetical protein